MTEEKNEILEGEVALPHQANDIKPDEVIEHEAIEPKDKDILAEIAPPPPAVEDNDLPIEYCQPNPPAKIRKGPISRLRELFNRIKR